MLLEAAIKYNIDLSESWMIGDSENDILAGKTAGCRVAFIGEGYESEIPCYMNLLSCVQDILNKEK